MDIQQYIALLKTTGDNVGLIIGKAIHAIFAPTEKREVVRIKKLRRIIYSARFLWVERKKTKGKRTTIIMCSEQGKLWKITRSRLMRCCKRFLKETRAIIIAMGRYIDIKSHSSIPLLKTLVKKKADNMRLALPRYHSFLTGKDNLAALLPFFHFIVLYGTGQQFQTNADHALQIVKSILAKSGSQPVRRHVAPKGHRRGAIFFVPLESV